MNEKSISINFPDKIIFLLRILSFHIKQQSAVHDDVLFKKKVTHYVFNITKEIIPGISINDFLFSSHRSFLFSLTTINNNCARLSINGKNTSRRKTWRVLTDSTPIFSSQSRIFKWTFSLSAYVNKENIRSEGNFSYEISFRSQVKSYLKHCY